jgi:hypothetical protein
MYSSFRCLCRCSRRFTAQYNRLPILDEISLFNDLQQDEAPESKTSVPGMYVICPILFSSDCTSFMVCTTVAVVRWAERWADLFWRYRQTPSSSLNWKSEWLIQDHCTVVMLHKLHWSRNRSWLDHGSCRASRGKIVRYDDDNRVDE